MTDFVTLNNGKKILRTLVSGDLPPQKLYNYGRSGSNGNDTWLRGVGNVVSNRTGRTVDTTNSFVARVTYSSRDVETYEIEIYEHDGNQSGLTLLSTINVVAESAGFQDVNIPVTTGRQVAVRLGQTFTGNVRDPRIDLTVHGEN